MIPIDGFWLGPIKIYFYSLCLLAAVWVGYALAVRRGQRYKLSSVLISDAIVAVVVAGVLGGRLGFVIQNTTYFTENPGDILRLTSGGLSIHGALLGGLLVLWLFARHRKLAFWQLTDLFAIPLLAGQIIGRLGNYFNQELFGYPTQLPWGITINPSNRPAGYFSETTFHPIFAYEMLLHLVGLIVLWRIPNQKPGQVTLVYLIIFSASRFITEIWRISDRLAIGLSLAQAISLVIMVGSIALWLHLRQKGDSNESIKTRKTIT